MRSGCQQLNFLGIFHIDKVIAFVVFRIDGGCSDHVAVVVFCNDQCDLAVGFRSKQSCHGNCQRFPGVVKVSCFYGAFQNGGFFFLAAFGGRIDDDHIVLGIFLDCQVVGLGPGTQIFRNQRIFPGLTGESRIQFAVCCG